MAALPQKPAKAYIALGANLGKPREQCALALRALQRRLKLLRLSSFYATPALLQAGQASQPDYINAVASFSTRLEPRDLLAYLHEVELELGRVRRERWGARCIDLDLLLYDNQVLPATSDGGPILPHPRMLERSFVVLPLLEIAPDLRLPNGELLLSYKNSAEPSRITRCDNHVY